MCPEPLGEPPIEASGGQSEPVSPAPEPTPAAGASAPDAAAEPLFVPRTTYGFVKGGTPTSKLEAEAERRFQESEERRHWDDVQRELARTPIERGGARLYEHPLTQNPEVPQGYILLTYVNARRERIWPGECLADLKIGVDDANDIALIIICPRCLKGPKHAQDCQIMIRRSNRWFHFEAGRGEPFFMFDDGFGPRRYPSAGMIVESEPFTCGYCSWRAVIEKNMIIQMWAQ